MRYTLRAFYAQGYLSHYLLRAVRDAHYTVRQQYLRSLLRQRANIPDLLVLG